MAYKKVKASELRQKTVADLTKNVEELKKELFQLRIQKVTGGQTAGLLNIKHVRRSIARAKTVIAEKQRAEVSKLYLKKKYKPLDLRGPYHARSFRRRLQPHQKNVVARKLRVRQENFPQRKFAVLA